MSTVADLDRCRMCMGGAAAELLSLPGSTVVVTDGFWLAASGLDEPSLNQVLIHINEPPLLTDVIGQLEDRGHPALLMLAGDGLALASQVPASWPDAGELPIMAIDLVETPTAPDSRLRACTIEDAGAITDLFCAAFESDREVFTTFLADCFVRSEIARWWMLEAGGIPVSVVLAVRVAESVSLWCMATPPAHARRGYARALLSAVLHHAAHNGAMIGLLGATPAGYPLYEATGWTDIEHWQTYIKPAAAT